MRWRRSFPGLAAEGLGVRFGHQLGGGIAVGVHHELPPVLLTPGDPLDQRRRLDVHGPPLGGAEVGLVQVAAAALVGPVAHDLSGPDPHPVVADPGMDVLAVPSGRLVVEHGEADPGAQAAQGGERPEQDDLLLAHEGPGGRLAHGGDPDPGGVLGNGVDVVHQAPQAQPVDAGQQDLHRAHLAQDPVDPPIGVPAEVPARGVRRVVGDAGDLQGVGVQVGEVHGGVQDGHRVVRADRVELLPAQLGKPGEEGGVEAPAEDPRTRLGRGGGGLQLAENLRQRAMRERAAVDPAVDQRGYPQVHVRFDQPGIQDGVT